MVVDDHPVWRDGVRADLEASGRVEVVAEAADGGDAIERAREAMPELVLMDLNLPTVPGVEAIRRIVEESPHVNALVLGEFRRMSGTTEPGLTARETEVLRLVAKGYTYKEIADQLFLSTKTVQNHVQNILTKLQLSRRYELMRYAIRRGLDRS